MAQGLTVELDAGTPASPDERQRLDEIIARCGGDVEAAALGLFRAAWGMTADIAAATVALKVFDERKAAPGEDTIDLDDLERLDGYNVDVRFEDIVNAWLRNAGGDPMLALRRMTHRAMANDNELDMLRVTLYRLQIKHGGRPIDIDADATFAHLKAVLNRSAAEKDMQWRLHQAGQAPAAGGVQ